MGTDYVVNHSSCKNETTFHVTCLERQKYGYCLRFLLQYLSNLHDFMVSSASEEHTDGIKFPDMDIVIWFATYVACIENTLRETVATYGKIISLYFHQEMDQYDGLH